jgi:hypothetical protein
VSCHDDCGVPLGVPECVLAQKRGSRAGWTRNKPDRSRDLPGFNAGPVDPVNSQGHASKFDLQLTRRESLSVI